MAALVDKVAPRRPSRPQSFSSHPGRTASRSRLFRASTCFLLSLPLSFLCPVFHKSKLSLVTTTPPSWATLRTSPPSSRTRGCRVLSLVRSIHSPSLHMTSIKKLIHILDYTDADPYLQGVSNPDGSGINWWNNQNVGVVCLLF
jgi:hypothetical protein